MVTGNRFWSIESNEIRSLSAFGGRYSAVTTAAIASSRTSLAIAVLMVVAGICAVLARPGAGISGAPPAISLEAMVPTQFGDWREMPQGNVQVVNPQTKELLDKLYSQLLSRVYVNAAGYRIMLSLAYGSDQRGALQAHKPEVCYPAQGFFLHKNEPGILPTEFGGIAVRPIGTCPAATASMAGAALLYGICVTSSPAINFSRRSPVKCGVLPAPADP